METNTASSLYQLATKAVINNFAKLRHGLDLCPENILFDVIYHVHTQDARKAQQTLERKPKKSKGGGASSSSGEPGRGKPTLLTSELSQFNTFKKLLKVGDKRASLHQMLQATVESKADVPGQLAQSFYGEVERLLGKLCSATHNNLTVGNTCRTLELGFSLGGFLCEAGWYPAATTVHRGCVNILRRMNQNEPNYVFVKLECLSKLLHSLSSYCQFTEASAVFHELSQFIWEQSLTSATYPNLAHIYNEFSSHHFVKSDYHEAYTWAMEAVKLLTPQSPAKLAVDVLRQASKSCVVKREFTKAELLVKQAVRQARETYGVTHCKYADCLIDYGFYLLNVDCITASMQVYKNALDVRLDSFGAENLQVATAHEDLAYATYVNEYSTGKFSEARKHAELSLSILGRHLPAQHLLLASSKRVLALILEEIAIDSQGQTAEKSLLSEAESLHLFALQLATSSFGECNVQTAKHYGNLGRLYQTMERYKEAERMHLKAIQIKESLLGTEDYEVALSVGHLASLYNYDMEEYGKAEELYLRSIRIGRKLFGLSYSGLEYDYRGLIQVYHNTGNYERLMEYRTVLEEWKISRDARDAEQNTDQDVEEECRLSLPELIQNVTQ